MATTKTVNVTTGKVLNYQVKKAGYKPVIGSVYVDSDKTVNVNLIPTASASDVYTLGDRLLGIASFVCYYAPGGTHDTEPIDTAVATQTVGTGLQNLGVKKTTFRTAVSQTEGNYLFTYDGTNWNYNSSAVTLSDYGIFYNTLTSTPTSGDTIKVEYTVYNKYAVFVLDSNYRTNAKFGYNETDFSNYPKYSSVNAGSGTSDTVWYYNQMSGQESATWGNQTLLDNRGYTQSGFPAMYHCRNLGLFVLPNGMQINALIPNVSELYKIWQNRAYLDSIDPVIQSGSTAYNLTNWNFGYSRGLTVQENNYRRIWLVRNDGVIQYDDSGDGHIKNHAIGVIPVFEVPCK